MHQSSLENMYKCYERYVRSGPHGSRDRVTVVDIGGVDTENGYRQIFNEPRFHYVTVDLESAPGVVVNLTDPYKLPFDDRSVDIVLSGQMLEHCEFFWLAFAEWVRVLKPDGYIFLIAPSAGRIHPGPVDCYRFYPDAYRALAKYTNCRLIEVWRDERGPWQDLVGVFARHAIPEVGAPLAAETLVPNRDPPPAAGPGTAEEEASAGARPLRDVLADLHELLQPRSYLEIGVGGDDYLALARGPAVGVGPELPEGFAAPAGARVLQMTSDRFFETSKGRFLETAKKKLGEPPDLVLLNGAHLIEYLLNDFMQLEEIAAPHALVVVPDTSPNHPAQAARRPRTRLWTGDAWKLAECLGRYRPDLYLQPIDAAPAGALLIGGLAAGHEQLWQRHALILRDLSRMDDPPTDILERRGAIAPDRTVLTRITSVLAAARDGRMRSKKMVEALREASRG